MKLGKILLGQEEIARRVRELAGEIEADYRGLEPHLVCILKGALFFTVDLMRELRLPVTLGFLSASSYGDRTTSSGEVRLELSALGEVRGRHVLLVEDIVDTGLTLLKIKDALLEMHPATLKVCALFEKKARRSHPLRLDYLGFEMPDRFIVGYGLDFAERWRELPCIRALEED